MDRKLLDYLPPVLREVMEMQAINEANEPEISLVWDAMTLVLANQFLETADARGVAVWEKELKIIPKDTDTLEMRKARIKARWNLNTPYTVPWLKSWLTSIFGPKGYLLGITDYTLDLSLDCGALQNTYITVEEILDIFKDILPENILYGVSYMVRRGIIIRHRMDSWSYRVPECGTIRCGTWWMYSTLGWSEKPTLSIDADPGPVLVSPELAGTLPDIKTPGWSVCGALRVGGIPEVYAARPEFTGTEPCGIVWTPAVVGWSEHRTVVGRGTAEPFAVSPELAGTLPDTAATGYTVAGELSTVGGVDGFKTQPEMTGTLPQEAQHGERED